VLRLARCVKVSLRRRFGWRSRHGLDQVVSIDAGFLVAFFAEGRIGGSVVVGVDPVGAGVVEDRLGSFAAVA
jgi:hypothetical protein